MKQQHSHEHPNNFTFSLIAKACAKLSDLKLAQIIHAHVVKTPHSSDIYVQTAMVDMYVKCSNLECGHHLFDEMPDRDVSSWNAVIMGFAQMGDFDRVSLLSNRMRIDGILPDAVTIMVLTQLMSGIKDLRLLSSVHYFGSKVGLDTTSRLLILGFLWNTLITGCAYFEDSRKAREVYNRVLRAGYKPDFSTILNLLLSVAHPNCLYHGMLIHGHGVKMGCDSDTLISMYSKCGDISSEPDLVIVIHWTLACGKVGALEVGKLIDNYTISNGLKSNVTVCNALLDMYAKCGSFALNGKSQATLDRCNRMLKTGFQPNHVTFIAVLQACTHASLLEMGLKFFNMMIKPYKINPVLDHYSCMVDLLGRRGKFKGALKFIQEMPLQPDAGIWGALLSACKIHHNLEISEFAADQLFLLEP
ncbi:hypothetical protein BUALT_Bualt19G0120100 [Buddleja alternifolia]|uniref:Pentatricopeptide repeat-containing protein n=1 Tax=Buddleja alternifolia TaxID=168488 RepID=A0AAV6W9J9_9LAMI|nr:hypothetical protein BUALT_Bualt19G0120100 [Buddleja alternifolia]